MNHRLQTLNSFGMIRRSVSVSLMTVGFAWRLQANAAEPPPSAPYVESQVLDWDKLKVKPRDNGAVRVLFNGPTRAVSRLEGHISTLLPGKQSHPPHRHGYEEVIIIKEGNVVVFINGVTHPAGVGSVIFIASGDLHNIRNEGTIPATYHIISYETDKTSVIEKQ